MCCCEFPLFPTRAALIICALNDLSWGGSSLYFLSQSQSRGTGDLVNTTSHSKQVPMHARWQTNNTAIKKNEWVQSADMSCCRTKGCQTTYRNNPSFVLFLSVPQCLVCAMFEAIWGALSGTNKRDFVETCLPHVHTKAPSILFFYLPQLMQLDDTASTHPRHQLPTNFFTFNTDVSPRLLFLLLSICYRHKRGDIIWLLSLVSPCVNQKLLTDPAQDWYRSLSGEELWKEQISLLGMLGLICVWLSQQSPDWQAV